MTFTLAEIRRVRERLPIITHTAILEARKNGLSWQQIADELGVSVSGVRLAAETKTTV